MSEDEPLTLSGMSPRRIEFDYIRTFAVVLVVLHHAILAYATFADFSFSPVKDDQKWVGFNWIALINDYLKNHEIQWIYSLSQSSILFFLVLNINLCLLLLQKKN